MSYSNNLRLFFGLIDTQLTLYENLKDIPAWLELAIWKLKITEKFDQTKNIRLTTEMKMQCRDGSISSVNIIVPNVMYFLTGQ